MSHIKVNSLYSMHRVAMRVLLTELLHFGQEFIIKVVPSIDLDSSRFVDDEFEDDIGNHGHPCVRVLTTRLDNGADLRSPLDT